MVTLIMNTNSIPDQKRPVTRRAFLKTGAVATVGIASLSLRARAQTNKNGNLRIYQIGIGAKNGGIGSLQRAGLRGHPKVEWAGFCDVDSREREAILQEHPKAWTIADYREGFADKVDDFDAVIVDTPDFNHAPMMITALKHNKHIYGQKPLVQQLSELRMMRDALAQRPDLVTQMGNQRSCNRGRMLAVEMLRRNQLGRPIEAYVWTGSVERNHYFADPWSNYTTAKPVPDWLSWDLWQGPINHEMPYSEDLTPRRWRTFWETGGGQLADWGCHLLDLLYFAYDLPRPEAVLTNTLKPPMDSHTAHNISTITYPGGGKFAREKFVVRYSDSALVPSFAALGLPDVKVGANYTMVVCEEGTLLLQADGVPQVFRKGKEIQDEPLPEIGKRNHWKDWADDCLGDHKPLWTPFQIGWRITEPALLAVKATRFPDHELRWDAENFRFTNNDEANKTILSREYREGFAPPQIS
ncbi:hypothetical protein GC207_11175 [bacterium]|nr:hypothetical protein [bacterium]